MFFMGALLGDKQEGCDDDDERAYLVVLKLFMLHCAGTHGHRNLENTGERERTR